MKNTLLLFIFAAISAQSAMQAMAPASKASSPYIVPVRGDDRGSYRSGGQDWQRSGDQSRYPGDYHNIDPNWGGGGWGSYVPYDPGYDSSGNNNPDPLGPYVPGGIQNNNPGNNADPLGPYVGNI